VAYSLSLKALCFARLKSPFLGLRPMVGLRRPWFRRRRRATARGASPRGPTHGAKAPKKADFQSAQGRRDRPNWERIYAGLYKSIVAQYHDNLRHNYTIFTGKCHRACPAKTGELERHPLSLTFPASSQRQCLRLPLPWCAGSRCKTIAFFVASCYTIHCENIAGR